MRGEDGGSLRVRGLLQQMAVFLEHRTAAAGVVDDGIDLGELLAEGVAVGGGELLGRLDESGVIVQRAAAALGARNPHLAAVALQHAGGGQRRLREEGIGGAADEQGHARPPSSLRRQQFRQSAVVRRQTRHDLLHAPQRRRQEPAHAAAPRRPAPAAATNAAAPAPSACGGAYGVRWNSIQR